MRKLHFPFINNSSSEVFCLLSQVYTVENFLTYLGDLRWPGCESSFSSYHTLKLQDFWECWKIFFKALQWKSYDGWRSVSPMRGVEKNVPVSQFYWLEEKASMWVVGEKWPRVGKSTKQCCYLISFFKKNVIASDLFFLVIFNFKKVSLSRKNPSPE